MVAAGEASGNLDGVLNRIAEYQEKSDSLRRKVVGAMTYPAIVIDHRHRPNSSHAHVHHSDFCTDVYRYRRHAAAAHKDSHGHLRLLPSFFTFLILGGIGGAFAFTAYYRTEDGKFNIDNIKLKLPIFGELERKSSVSRFSQTLSTLLTSGVTILDALAITAKTAGNKVLEKGLIRTTEKISGGQTISEPLKETGIFPPMVIQMIAVGEKTGDLSGMLSKISEFYTEEVDAAVDALTSIIEPIMIIMLGVLVGGMLIAMYLPIFGMVGTIS